MHIFCVRVPVGFHCDIPYGTGIEVNNYCYWSPCRAGHCKHVTLTIDFCSHKTGANAVLNIRFSGVKVNGDKLPDHVDTTEYLGIQTRLVCLI